MKYFIKNDNNNNNFFNERLDFKVSNLSSKTTLCFILQRTSCKMLTIYPLKPVWHKLKSIPLCQTVSKALEMSKNIPQTLILLSKTFKISELIERSGLMQELTGLNPDCFGERSLLSKKSWNNQIPCHVQVKLTQEGNV